jgi:hypothetical protein
MNDVTPFVCALSPPGLVLIARPTYDDPTVVFVFDRVYEVMFSRFLHRQLGGLKAWWQ